MTRSTPMPRSKSDPFKQALMPGRKPRALTPGELEELEAKMLVLGATSCRDSEDAKQILLSASALLQEGKPLPAPFREYLGKALAAIAAEPKKAARILNLVHPSRPSTSSLEAIFLAARVARHKRQGKTDRAAIRAAGAEVGIKPEAAEKRMRSPRGVAASDFFEVFEAHMLAAERKGKKAGGLGAELQRATGGSPKAPETDRVMDLMLGLLSGGDSIPVRKKQ